MNFFALFSYGPSDKFDNINKILRLNFAHLSYIYMDFQIIKGNRILIYLDHINEFIMNVACIPCIAKMTVTYIHVQCTYWVAYNSNIHGDFEIKSNFMDKSMPDIHVWR